MDTQETDHIADSRLELFTNSMGQQVAPNTCPACRGERVYAGGKVACSQCNGYGVIYRAVAYPAPPFDEYRAAVKLATLILEALEDIGGYWTDDEYGGDRVMCYVPRTCINTALDFSSIGGGADIQELLYMAEEVRAGLQERLDLGTKYSEIDERQQQVNQANDEAINGI